MLTGAADRESLPLACPACRSPVRWGTDGARCAACGAQYGEADGVLKLTEGSVGRPGYDPHFFSRLTEIEDEHFWFVARRQVIVNALRQWVPDLSSRRLFDIGCGTGGLLAFLAESGVPLAGACDAYLQGLARARTRVDAPLVLVDEGRLPPIGPGLSLVGMFDVLEHIDDDTGTLSWIASILEPAGVLVLTVPAHPFLFGAMDELAHHRRRYTGPELRGKLAAAGLEIVRVRHFMAPLVPVLALANWTAPRWGRAGRDGGRDAQLRVVRGVNRLLRGVLALERAWLRFLPLPFGSSLIAVAVRRPNRATSSDGGTRG
jgi:SAM-dependent methyltransferase